MTPMYTITNSIKKKNLKFKIKNKTPFTHFQNPIAPLPITIVVILKKKKKTDSCHVQYKKLPISRSYSKISIFSLITIVLEIK